MSTRPLLPQRRLKVRQTCHCYQFGQRCKDRTAVGEIHLKGHWLIKADFAIDSPVTVQVKPGCIVVTKA